MFGTAKVIFKTDTAFGHYQVLDMVYEGRQARVLYSGQNQAAQSGVPRDGQPDMLFDYNQRLFELVTYLKPKRMLLVGGGVYTLPSALLQVLSNIHIDVVEIDAELDDIARQYFDWQPNTRLKVIHEDGRQYLERTDSSYDVIVLDAFSHLSIPASLTEPAALEQLKRHLTPHGVVAANIISAYYGRRADTIMKIADSYDNHFSAVDIYPASQKISFWLSQNFILVAQQTPAHSLDEALRYPKLTETINPYNISQDLGH